MKSRDPNDLMDQSRSLLKKLREEYPEVHRIEVKFENADPMFIVCADPEQGHEFMGIFKLQRFPKEWHDNKVILKRERADGTPLLNIQ